MAKGRMVNKSISLSLKLDTLPDDTCRLLATWLMPQLDFRGVTYGDAAAVKSLVFPLRADISVERVDGYLQAMAANGLIVLFTSGGRRWQYWPGFAHNQVGMRIERERSDFPVPPECRQDDATLAPESRQDDAEKPAELNIKENNLTQSNTREIAAPPPAPETVSQTDPAINRVEATTQTPPTTEFHEDSPKPGKVEPAPARPRDLLFDAIAEVTQSNVALLGSRIGKTAAELRKINATPDQVRQVAKWFHAYDWRGKKGEKLTFEILKEVWQPGLKGTAPASPSGGRNRPQVPGYTEQQRQAAAAKSAARNAGRDADQLDGRLAKARQDRANAVNRGDATAVAYFDQMITTLEGRIASERVTA